MSTKYEEIKQIVEAEHYKIITPIEEFNENLPVLIKSCDGYLFKIKYKDNGNYSIKHMVGKNNEYSIYNINNYLRNHHVPFECVSTEYKDAYGELEFICNRCGDHVLATWKQINRNDNSNRHHILCPNCDGRTESVHALVLKQMFKYEYPDSIEEEHSCRNPATGKILPTDIVNHRLKIAVEIQSQWHDFEDKKVSDAYKKQFWIDKGYSFYDPDIRDYTILEMCQLFFDIDELPDYINYEYSNKLNIKKFQKLLNDGLSIPEIESVTGTNRHRIYDAIYSGKLVYPNNYQNPGHTPILQFDEKGNFVGEFETISQASKFNGVKNGLIDGALSRENHYGGGFYWFRKSEFDPVKFKLGHRTSKFMIPVEKYDKAGSFICSYDTIIDASKDNNVSNMQIYNVVIGKFKQTGGYVYKRAV